MEWIGWDGCDLDGMGWDGMGWGGDRMRLDGMDGTHDRKTAFARDTANARKREDSIAVRLDSRRELSYKGFGFVLPANQFADHGHGSALMGVSQRLMSCRVSLAVSRPHPHATYFL